MANLLYRIGRACARRAWTVIGAWLALLVVAGGAFLAFGGELATSFSIPGTETERVTTQLADEIPDLAGSSATVTFETLDGSALTDAQRDQIIALLEDVATIDGVTGTTDPFTAQATLDANVQTIADGKAQLESGKAQLDEAQAQLDGAEQQLADARAQLDAGQAELDAAVAQAQAAGVYAAVAPQLTAKQAELDAAAAQLDAKTAEWQAGKDALAEKIAEFESGAAELSAGERLLALADGIAFVSEDGSAARGTVSFAQDAFSLEASIKTAVTEALDAAQIDGVQVGYSSSIATHVEGILGFGEIIGVLIAALVLVIMLRAFLPAVTPLITSIVGVGVGAAGAMAFSGVVQMSSVTPVLGVMLGLAVGIDYSLFILNRHRTQLLAGAEVEESIGMANGTSGNAVVFAGSTVIVALLALVVTGIPFLRVMGFVAAGCVAIAVLVSVTLTPAVLSLMGERVLGRKHRGDSSKAEIPVVRPMRHRTAVLMGIAGTLFLLLMAAPALGMRLGMPEGNSAQPDSPEYIAHEVLAEHFGEGANGPLLVVATLPEPVAEEHLMSTQLDLAEAIADRDNVVSVLPVATSADRTVVAFQVIPTTGASSVETENLVHDLRSSSPLDGGVELGVAGATTSAIDVSAKLDAALPVYLLVVVGLSLVILVFVFRSLVVPVVATGGFVLSLFAALGAVTAVYQWGWLSNIFDVHNPAPVLSFAPILIMGVLFGLAMDYQLFLVSGMREAYVHGVSARTAVVAGLRNGRAVVTAAAIIMTSVFGGFIFSHLTMIRPLGFGLAVGVLFDAFVVRMVLVPSAMHLLGDAAWWMPRWLDRFLPNVDVEGAALERSHPLHVEEAAEDSAAPSLV